jgi:hypothetical protein
MVISFVIIIAPEVGERMVAQGDQPCVGCVRRGRAVSVWIPKSLGGVLRVRVVAFLVAYRDSGQCEGSTYHPGALLLDAATSVQSGEGMSRSRSTADSGTKGRSRKCNPITRQGSAA